MPPISKKENDAEPSCCPLRWATWWWLYFSNQNPLWSHKTAPSFRKEGQFIVFRYSRNQRHQLSHCGSCTSQTSQLQKGGECVEHRDGGKKEQSCPEGWDGVKLLPLLHMLDFLPSGTEPHLTYSLCLEIYLRLSLQKAGVIH